jgi:hypothetical protein
MLRDPPSVRRPTKKKVTDPRSTMFTAYEHLEAARHLDGIFVEDEIR